MAKETTETRDGLRDSTRRVFEPRANRGLTDEDVREIGENFAGFFGVLAGWARAERKDPLSHTAGEVGTHCKESMFQLRSNNEICSGSRENSFAKLKPLIEVQQPPRPEAGTTSPTGSIARDSTRHAEQSASEPARPVRTKLPRHEIDSGLNALRGASPVQSRRPTVVGDRRQEPGSARCPAASIERDERTTNVTGPPSHLPKRGAARSSNQRPGSVESA
jgi:hypothetical protein